jgi:3-phenylpropionate/cinnamic acid dioxygenase small subunit
MWRRIAGYIEREFRKGNLVAAQVNYVGYQPRYDNQYTYQQHPYGGSLYLGEVEDAPGNGEGPSA